MNRTIDAGSGLLALGGLLLLVGLFLPWFDGDSAWTAFESLDLILAALAVAAIAAGAGRLGDDSRAGVAIALAALVATALQLVDPPPAYGDAGRGTGAWFSLIASLIMVIGAAQALASFSVSVDVRTREQRRRVAAVDRRQPEPPRPESSDDDQRTQSMSALEVPGE